MSTLFGNEWVGDTEPTTGVLAGQSWIQPTSGDMSRRNSSNTAWVVVGNINDAMGGAVSKSGDTMTGALLGAPNLPPLEDPDFQGTVFENGFPLATQLLVNRLQANLREYINSAVRAQYLAQTKLSGTAADIAANFTVLSYPIDTWVDPTHVDGVAAPLPVFQSDGVQATSAQVVAWGYAALSSLGESGSSNIQILSPGQMQVKITWSGFTDNFTFAVGVWCLAVR